MKRVLATLMLPALSVLLAADDTVADRVAKVKAKHDAAVQAAADVYWRAKLAADKDEAAALAALSKRAPAGQQQDISAEAAAAKAAADDDADGVRSHAPVFGKFDVQHQVTVAVEAAKDKAAGTTAVPDAIKQAIADHKLAIGMTVEQANEALGTSGRVVAESGLGTTYEWDFAGHTVVVNAASNHPYVSQIPPPPPVQAMFEGGKLASWSR